MYTDLMESFTTAALVIIVFAFSFFLIIKGAKGVKKSIYGIKNGKN
jgi:hypothetical protein